MAPGLRLLFHRARQGAGLRGTVYIVASPFKTATTTVGHALVDLGAGKRCMGYDAAVMRSAKPIIRRLNALVTPDQNFAHFKRQHGAAVRRAMLPLLPKLAHFDIFADAPLGHTHFHPFVRKIIAPKARFIWVNRDTKEWLRSARRWETAHPDVYRNHTVWADDAKSRRRVLRQKWRAHWAEFTQLRDAFPDDCLVIDMADLNDYAALASFTGRPVIPGAMPRHNVG